MGNYSRVNFLLLLFYFLTGLVSSAPETISYWINTKKGHSPDPFKKNDAYPDLYKKDTTGSKDDPFYFISDANYRMR